MERGIVLIIHPYHTELKGEVESVSLSSVNIQIVEAVILSEEGLTEMLHSQWIILK